MLRAGLTQDCWAADGRTLGQISSYNPANLGSSGPAATAEWTPLR